MNTPSIPQDEGGPTRGATCFCRCAEQSSTHSLLWSLTGPPVRLRSLQAALRGQPAWTLLSPGCRAGFHRRCLPARTCRWLSEKHAGYLDPGWYCIKIIIPKNDPGKAKNFRLMRSGGRGAGDSFLLSVARWIFPAIASSAISRLQYCHLLRFARGEDLAWYTTA